MSWKIAELINQSNFWHMQNALEITSFDKWSKSRKHENIQTEKRMLKQVLQRKII